MSQSDKQTVIDSVRQNFALMTSAVFVDFSGMNVAQVSALRGGFRSCGVKYRVVKNTLLKIALKDQPCAAGLDSTLKGMTGVAWSFEEPSAAARICKEFAKTNEKLKIKAGLLDGRLLDAKAVADQLATLPSKDEARAMLLATFMAPAQQFVMLLNTPAGNFVRVLNAKKDAG